MRGDSVKLEAPAVIGEHRAETHSIRIARMPGEHGIDVFEEARVQHVNLPAAAFFRGGSVIANGPFEPASLHFFFNRDRRERRRRSEQIVAASMSRSAGLNRIERGGFFL